MSKSLTKGTRGWFGRLQQRNWETDNGEKRSKVEVLADEVGPSLLATARSRRPSREGDGFDSAPTHRTPPVAMTTTSRSDGQATAEAGKPKDTGRRVKKKVSILNSEQVATSTGRTPTCCVASCRIGPRSVPGG